MAVDRDYYSGAFLDWFPGNIQHLNSIASVLQCPPAARRQNNETADRAGGGGVGSEAGRFAAHSRFRGVGGGGIDRFHRSVVTLAEARPERRVHGRAPISRWIGRRRINIHARRRSDFYPDRCFHI